MEIDHRIELENELEELEDSQLEDWIARCFASCDPRYDADWLSSIFELAQLHFPDHYEVRSACSQAGILEAKRLEEEGDHAEAVSRLERLLDSDPYCAEALELLEVILQRQAELIHAQREAERLAAESPPAATPA